MGAACLSVLVGSVVINGDDQRLAVQDGIDNLFAATVDQPLHRAAR